DLSISDRRMSKKTSIELRLQHAANKKGQHRHQKVLPHSMRNLTGCVNAWVTYQIFVECLTCNIFMPGTKNCQRRHLRGKISLPREPRNPGARVFYI
ncbi:MAG: hypothetical protein ABR534_15155, partial [Desulfotignum sp.]